MKKKKPSPKGSKRRTDESIDPDEHGRLVERHADDPEPEEATEADSSGRGPRGADALIMEVLDDSNAGNGKNSADALIKQELGDTEEADDDEGADTDIDDEEDDEEDDEDIDDEDEALDEDDIADAPFLKSLSDAHEDELEDEEDEEDEEDAPRRYALPRSATSYEVDQLRCMLTNFVRPGECRELRVLPRDGGGNGLTGVFDDPEAALAALDRIPRADRRRMKGWYATLNPVVRTPTNAFAPLEYGTGCGNADILVRHAFLLDVDQASPRADDYGVGYQIALHRTDGIIRYLTGTHGWPKPLKIATGNGCQLLYTIELPNDRASHELLKRVERALADQFSDGLDATGWSWHRNLHDRARIIIDTGRHAAAQIFRLPGTPNRKSPPYRMALIASMPSAFEPVPIEKLQEMAAKAKLANHSPMSSSVVEPGDASSEERVAAARRYISAQHAVSGHGGHARTFNVAMQLVHGFQLYAEDAWALLNDWNSSNARPRWTEAELRHKLDSAAQTEPQREAGWLIDWRHHRPRQFKTQGYEQLKRLEGPTFPCAVPDWGLAVKLSDDPSDRRKFLERPHLVAGYFSAWRQLVSRPAVAEELYRAVRWGAHFPRNWRPRALSDLTRQAEQLPCEPANCVICRDGLVRHRAAWFPVSGRFGRPEVLADGEATEHRRRLVLRYWPGVLFAQAIWFGLAPCILCGMTRELTLPQVNRKAKTRVRKPVQYKRGLVECHQTPRPKAGGGSAGRHQIICPFLDRESTYEGFNGGGRRRGRGYQMVGRDGGGWLPRLGLEVQPYSDDRFDAMGDALHGLAVLAQDLDLTVCALNHRASPENRWKDLTGMQAALRNGAGREWLDECSMRIYVEAGWEVRWRHFFAQELGFGWIPQAIDDPGPGRLATATVDSVRTMMKDAGVSQRQLAQALGVNHSTVGRLLNGKTRNEALLESAVVELEKLIEE